MVRGTVVAAQSGADTTVVAGLNAHTRMVTVERIDNDKYLQGGRIDPLMRRCG